MTNQQLLRTGYVGSLRNPFMRETTSSFPQLKAGKTAGQISACTKTPILGSPAASTVSAIVIPDISNLEEGTEKSR